MPIKRNIIFYSLLCTGVYVCAMYRPWKYDHTKSMYENLWEKHLEERRQFFEKLGQPVPDEPTYEEAMVIHLRNKAHSEQTMREEMQRKMEGQKK